MTSLTVVLALSPAPQGMGAGSPKTLQLFRIPAQFIVHLLRASMKPVVLGLVSLESVMAVRVFGIIFCVAVRVFFIRTLFNKRFQEVQDLRNVQSLEFF